MSATGTASSPPGLLITVNGLPAHPLIVHAAVVLAPLAVLAALGYLVPKWHDWLRWPLVVVAVLASASVWAAFYTGGNFRDSATFFRQGSLGQQLDKHASYANVLAWVTTGLAVVAVVVAGFLHATKGGPKVVLGGVLGVLAVVTLVYVFLTGEAGARAVYPSSAPVSRSAPVVDPGSGQIRGLVSGLSSR